MHRIAMCLDFISVALEWVLVKLSIRVLPGLVFFFQLENFQDLESRTNITPCHYIIESYQVILNMSSEGISVLA